MKIAVVTARAPQTFSSAKGVRNDNTQRSLVSKYQPPSSLSHIELSHTTPQTLRNKRTSEPSHLNKFSSHRNSYTLRMSSTKQSTFAGRTGSDVEYQASDYGAIYSSKNPVRNKTRLESAGPSFSTRYERSYKRANGKSIKNVNYADMAAKVKQHVTQAKMVQLVNQDEDPEVEKAKLKLPPTTEYMIDRMVRELTWE